MKLLATVGSKNLNDNTPNPTLNSNIPPNKKEVKSNTRYAISHVGFKEQNNKRRNHRSKK